MVPKRPRGRNVGFKTASWKNTWFQNALEAEKHLRSVEAEKNLRSLEADANNLRSLEADNNLRSIEAEEKH